MHSNKMAELGNGEKLLQNSNATCYGDGGARDTVNLPAVAVGLWASERNVRDMGVLTARHSRRLVSVGRLYKQARPPK